MRAPTPARRLVGLIVELFRHVSPERRYQFVVLLGLTLVSSVAEAVSLGAVVPFIAILTQPARVFAHPAMAGVISALNIDSADRLVLPMVLGFGGAALVAGTLRLLLLRFSIRVANATGADLSIDVYRRTLYQPYSVHVARNSSEIISGTQKVATATGILMALTAVVTSLSLFAAIMVTLLVIDPVPAGTAMLVFGSGYAIIAWTTRRRLRRNSQSIADEQTTVVKTLQEGLGGIREVLLDGTQAVYAASYARAVRTVERANSETGYINQAPRFAIETLALVLVAGLAYSVHRSGSVGDVLPVIGALALGAQRLLPLLQQVYSNWVVVAGSQVALEDVLRLLDQPLPHDALTEAPSPLAFTRGIHFKNVSFRYATGPLVLDDVDLFIPKGARVGFVGTTGSGKSTALDVLMSLLEPTSGAMLVDDAPIASERRRAWQRTIAHVPQSIYLADTSVAENIAFGVPLEHVDFERVRRAAVQAQIAEFIEASPRGYHTSVGERGIRLSGGQRQRIGIARALYKNASVLVFDEATNALDDATESAVMNAIDNLGRDLTILIVAHRLTTLQNCDSVVQIERGRIVAHGSYKDVVENNVAVQMMALRA